MATLSIRLFGKLGIECDGRPVECLDARKAQELLAYLLLNRRPHARETLASLLWGELPTAQARSYLRKALWQLQSALDAQGARLLQADAEWVHIDAAAELWVDVAAFEHAVALVSDVAGEELAEAQASAARGAAQLYRGDLLDGSYTDWCLYERERLQQAYLALLDKLMGHCEAVGAYDQGVAYGAAALRHDVAREQTHRRLMRLHYLAGDRTAALRQYERCAAALQRELDVEPTELTCKLYRQIRLGEPVDLAAPAAIAGGGPAVVSCLRQAQAALDELHERLSRELQAAIGSLTGELK